MPHTLFAPYTLGDLQLHNRIVMAPLTRNRANLDGDTVHALHVQYYAQRAGAGLIISEGTQVSAEGKGYFRTPGIHTVAQVAAWKAVTDAVHQKGGHIFCQLWHTGRVSHTQFQPGGQDPVAPSAIRADAETYAGDGMIEVSTPRALSTDEIPRLVRDYVHAAECAKQAGFDGIELHAANGYLIDQFFRKASNRREDRYGGSVENRTRILKEILDGLTTIWDGSRIGVRFSPFSHAGGVEPENPMETYLAAISHANAAGLVYMHMIEGETGGERTMSQAQIKQLRDAFNGAYMANNGYDRKMAMKAVDDGAELVAFGVPYIANPDLAERLEADAPLNKPDQSTFYGGGAEGYTDYPYMAAAVVPARRLPEANQENAKSETFRTINPATGATIASYDYMSDAEAAKAVENCHMAFRDWRKTSLEARGAILKQIGKGLRADKNALAKLMTQEMGKLLSQSLQEVELCAAICDWTADHAADALKTEERELGKDGKGMIFHSPIGVIYGIQPWNYPAYQVARYSIANLMAGNGVLLKHAENVTGTGQMLQKIYYAAGLPANLFTLLIISHEQSDTIIMNDLVRGVTLTGSPAAGREIGALAAKALKKTVLELGSNDAYIVLEDADIVQAVKLCVMGRTYNNGETCIAAKRFIVVDAVYDKFRDAFVEAMRALKSGDPTDSASDMGPIAREDLRNGLHEQVEQSVSKGAEILCGGKLPAGDGFYYPATVLANVTPGQPAYDDELFGPVASLIRAVDANDAMRIANDSRFGLGGGIMTTNIDEAIKMAAEQFDTGMVFINGFGLAKPNMPFGGVKASGYGREHGGFGMREFTNAKSVIING